MKKMINYSESVGDQITDQRMLGDVLRVVMNLIEKYGPETQIEFDSGYNNIDERLLLSREETDKEYEERIKKENKIVEKERREYERLKKKFGDTV